MGWVEVAVHREQRRYVRPYPYPYPPPYTPPYEPSARDRSEEAPAAPESGRSASDGNETAKKDAPVAEAPAAEGPLLRAPLPDASAGARSYPGTGWGARTDDPAVVVSFEPEPNPAERVTLRYEYRGALVALGILPRPWYGGDRLREREQGTLGFAKPPAW
jgi:hypothetical protein